MKTLILTPILFVACLMVVLLPASAAVIDIPDRLGATGGVASEYTNVSITGEGSLYYIGTMTFDVVDDSSSFFSFEATTLDNGGGDIIAQWTKTFNGTDVKLNNPGNVTLASGITDGFSFTMALKIDQTTGDYTYWFNPNFATDEGSNTATGSGTGANTATVESVGFRWGSGTPGVTDFTDFAVYTGSDTPFAIPEPSALLLSGLGFLLLLRRRP